MLPSLNVSLAKEVKYDRTRELNNVAVFAFTHPLRLFNIQEASVLMAAISCKDHLCGSYSEKAFFEGGWVG